MRYTSDSELITAAELLHGDFSLRMLTQRGKQWFRAGELASYVLGTGLTVLFVSQIALGEAKREAGIAEFEAAMAEPELRTHFSLDDAGHPDTSLWAPQRLVDYQVSIDGELPPILGVLEIPELELKVPVYPSDSDLNMDRGAGVIDGMSYPHEGGNIGIAGHRDGYFRVLKDVQRGDRLVLQTLNGPLEFVVDSTRVIEIDQTEILQDTRDTQVTLVTCYPFYFVGHAPQRFVVTASLDTQNVNQN